MTALALAPRPVPVFQAGKLILGMAHLSPAGLSEQWVLRHCGDLHWNMIARALGQDDAVFRAQDGWPVYAAFCTTSLRLDPFVQSLLGQQIQVSSSLQAVSDTRTGSHHRISAKGKVLAELSMISTFVSHDASGSNKRIIRNSVLGAMQLPKADAALVGLDQQARAMSRALRRRNLSDTPTAYTERPTPTLDFNAVGLLYFPTFSRLAETAAYAGQSQPRPLLQRDIVYLGNLDQGDTILVFGQEPDWFITRQDGVPIAAGYTRRAPL